MARFPIEDSKLPELGKALARAVNDPVARTEMERDTNAYLIDAGVDPASIQGLTFTVVDDTGTNLNIVLPKTIDEKKVAANDQDYLAALGQSVVLACTF